MQKSAGISVSHKTTCRYLRKSLHIVAKSWIMKGDTQAGKNATYHSTFFPCGQYHHRAKDHIDMIRENALYCKLFQHKKTAYDVFEEMIEGHRDDRMLCPHCGCRGKCVAYGSYERNLIDYEHKKVECRTIRVPRVICQNCSDAKHKCTHAILPDCIVPYSEYSLFFILKVLFEYHSHRKLRDICEKYMISPVQVYRWKRMLQKHKGEWLGILKAGEKTGRDFLVDISRLNKYSEDFGEPFLRRTSRSFLQSHANPTNCRYPRFSSA